jgi:hypothetical protein
LTNIGYDDGIPFETVVDELLATAPIFVPRA